MKRNNCFLPFSLILLTCLISFRFLFFVSYIHLKKVEFRRQILLTQTKEVIEFSFDKGTLFEDKNGFEWKKNNKELVVNGIYHEVVNISQTDSCAIVYVIEDKAENSLFQKYFSINKETQNDGTTFLKQILSLNYLTPELQKENTLCFEKIKHKDFKVLFRPNVFILKSIKPPEKFQAIA